MERADQEPIAAEKFQHSVEAASFLD